MTRPRWLFNKSVYLPCHFCYITPLLQQAGYGGLYQDCVTHDIDVHRWLIGDDPVEVFSHAHSVSSGPDDFDVCAVMMRWRSGAISMIDVSRVSPYGYDQRIEVLGSKGMAEAHNRPRTTFVVSTDQGCSHDTLSPSFTERYQDAYLSEALHFLELLGDRGAAPRVGYQDARNTFLICAAAEKSARTGQVIRIDYAI
jgi:myo-inositol 2-dehydrogenase / D-chiro-inositol 1-dehydrogenase